MDNYSAGYKGIEHLWRLGHDRIAIITGALNDSNAIASLEGSKAALKRFGIKIPKSYIKEGKSSQRKAFLVCERLMKSKNPPTAVFAHDDNMALGAREAILNLGLKIPKDKKTKEPFSEKQGGILSDLISKTAFKNGLILYPGSGCVDGNLGDHTLVAPPFIIEKQEIDEMVSILNRSFSEVENEVL